jgi:hypothetical protein
LNPPGKDRVLTQNIKEMPHPISIVRRLLSHGGDQVGGEGILIDGGRCLLSHPWHSLRAKIIGAKRTAVPGTVSLLIVPDHAGTRQMLENQNTGIFPDVFQSALPWHARIRQMDDLAGG